MPLTGAAPPGAGYEKIGPIFQPLVSASLYQAAGSRRYCGKALQNWQHLQIRGACPRPRGQPLICGSNELPTDHCPPINHLNSPPPIIMLNSASLVTASSFLFNQSGYFKISGGQNNNFPWPRAHGEILARPGHGYLPHFPY